MHTDYGSLTILRLGGAFPGGLQVMGATRPLLDWSVTRSPCVSVSVSMSVSPTQVRRAHGST